MGDLRLREGRVTMRTLVALAVLLFITSGSAAAGGGPNQYHGPSNKPRWLTTPCALEDENNCYWNAGGQGHSFWAIPVGPNKVAVVYWNPDYNRDHGYVTNR